MDMATNYIGESLGKETRDSYMMLAQSLLLVDGGYKYLNGKKKTANALSYRKFPFRADAES